MIKKTPDKFWFPFWVDKWIFGSLRLEFEPEERALWVDLLALAAKDNGFIRANEETPYMTKQLAGLLVYDEKFFEQTIQKFIDKGKLEKNKNGTLYISTWDKYKLSSGYKRVLKHRELEKEKKDDETAIVTTDKKSVTYIKSNHNITNNIKLNNKSEKTNSQFDILWKDWPPEGRFKKKYCLMKFSALFKAGKLEEFRKTTIGYFEYLKSKKIHENFSQQAMHLSTWLNNWEGEKENYLEYKYKPPL